MVRTKCRLQTAERVQKLCRLVTNADCGLGTKCRLSKQIHDGMSFYNLPSVTQSAFFRNISITMYCGIFLARFRDWPEWPGLTYLLAVLLISEKAAMLLRQPGCKDCHVLCHLLSISYCLLLFQNMESSQSHASSICDNTVLCRVCTFLTNICVHLDDKMQTKTQIVPST